jgi:signal transduction histidine kinase
MDEAQFIECMEDPVVVLDGDDRVVACNEASAPLFDPDDVAGRRVDDLFSSNPILARDHEEDLTHYPDLGAVVDGKRRHFEVNHPTIAAIRAGDDPREEDPDVGVLLNGEMRYYHLSTASPEATDTWLLAFREITETKRREQDLDFLKQVMTRVLRHNIRNDLSVINEYASAIEEGRGGDPAEMARTIQEKSESLVATSEKTRLIEKVIESDERVTVQVDSLVEDCIDDVREANPDADASVTVDAPKADVKVVPAFERALADTIENAVIYSEGGTVRIRGYDGDTRVSLSVADEGSGIPERELEALVQRGETDLVHGSGAGLWLIYTAVQQSRGEIAFDTGDDGTTVQMRLPTAE